jgi:uncharacterized protein YggU (UPF0235/DUF167 family)
MVERIAIRLTPRASRNHIGEWREGPNQTRELAVYVTAPPENHRANDALLELLAEEWNLSRSQLKLLSGHTSRHKVVEIHR